MERDCSTRSAPDLASARARRSQGARDGHHVTTANVPLLDNGRRKFADKMIAELRRAGLADEAELDEEEFRLVAGDVWINLGNAFAERQRASLLGRREVLRRYARALVGGPPELPDSAAEARPNLLIRVRDLDWCATMEIHNAAARGGGGVAMTYQPLNEHLAVEVVYDGPSTISVLAHEKLVEWGVSLEEAVRTGRANLRGHTQDIFLALAPGVYRSPWQDSYGAARLLLTELISRLALRGDPVALLPHRDHLLLTGSEDEVGLGRIAAIAEPLLHEPRQIIGRAFVLRDGSWLPFVPPDDHPHQEVFRRLVQVTEALAYGDQQGALDDLHYAESDEVFVASVMLTPQRHSHVDATSCTWTEGVRSLLPRTDRIAFISLGVTEAENRMWWVPWEEASAVMSDAMQPQGLRPERWLVETFPNADHLTALEQAAVPVDDSATYR